MSQNVIEEGKENRIRKILFNEISLMIAGVGLVSSVLFWVSNPQTELNEKLIRLEAQVESNESVTEALQKIKDNDLHEIQLRLDQSEARDLEIIKALARLQALHER